MKSGFAVLFFEDYVQGSCWRKFSSAIESTMQFISFDSFVCAIRTRFVQGKNELGALSRDFAGGHDASDYFFH